MARPRLPVDETVEATEASAAGEAAAEMAAAKVADGAHFSKWA